MEPPAKRPRAEPPALPHDVVRQIWSCLSGVDLCALRRVCRSWRDRIDAELVDPRIAELTAMIEADRETRGYPRQSDHLLLRVASHARWWRTTFRDDSPFLDGRPTRAQAAASLGFAHRAPGCLEDPLTFAMFADALDPRHLGRLAAKWHRFGGGEHQVVLLALAFLRGDAAFARSRPWDPDLWREARVGFRPWLGGMQGLDRPTFERGMRIATDASLGAPPLEPEEGLPKYLCPRAPPERTFDREMALLCSGGRHGDVERLWAESSCAAFFRDEHVCTCELCGAAPT